MRILCILSRILGNKTFSNQLISVLAQIPNVEPIILTLDNDDYSKYKANFLLQKSNFFESSAVIRYKFNCLQLKSFDLVIIQGIGLVPAFKDLIIKYPTILAHDSTPMLSNLLTFNENKSFYNRMVFYCKTIFFKYYFGNILGQIKVFLPRTELCATSLHSHFRINKDKIIITPVSFNLDKWVPLKNKNNAPKILLFVANDFFLKGGDFLIDVYGRFFSNKAILRIISNDKRIENIKFPLGVEVKSGFDHSNQETLTDLYRTADIMLHPTRKDFLPIVLIEAASVGLPIIASNIGAIKEIVSDNENGFLCSPSLNSNEWVNKISELLDDNAKREQFGQFSRKIAEQKYNHRRFSDNIYKSIRMAQC